MHAYTHTHTHTHTHTCACAQSHELSSQEVLYGCGAVPYTASFSFAVPLPPLFFSAIFLFVWALFFCVPWRKLKLNVVSGWVGRNGVVWGGGGERGREGDRVR